MTRRKPPLDEVKGLEDIIGPPLSVQLARAKTAASCARWKVKRLRVELAQARAQIETLRVALAVALSRSRPTPSA